MRTDLLAAAQEQLGIVTDLSDSQKLDIVMQQSARILEIMEAVSTALTQVQNHPMLGQFIGTPGR